MEYAAPQGNAYRQLADEIGAVLQSAADTAEKMIDDARAEAARIVAAAENDRRAALAEGRRILDEARMEADMARAEAEWQGQEIIAQARRQAAERIAAADARLAELGLAETRVLDRLAGVGQLLAEAMAGLRSGTAETAPAAAAEDADADADEPSAKVYFVEFPPPAPPMPTPKAEPETEIILTDPAAPTADGEHSEWAPPPEMPVWWTRGATEG